MLQYRLEQCDVPDEYEDSISYDVCTVVSAGCSPDPVALWLCQLPGMSVALLTQLLAVFGSADAVLRASSGALRTAGVTPVLVAQIVAGPRQIAHVTAGLKGLQRLGIVPLPFAAPTYPARLKALAEPPLVVYVKGQWPLSQPFALVVPPSEAEPRVVAQWTELASVLQPHIGFGALLQGTELDLVKPSVLGVSHGLMLARQRLPQALWQQVTAGHCTLIATSAPTAQPDPAASRMTYRALVALADVLVTLLPQSDDLDDVIATAHTVSVPMFGVAPTTRAPLPPQMRRLRPGKPGLRALSTALGVHLDGAATIQQERLF